jgi:hypothetical protein
MSDGSFVRVRAPAGVGRRLTQSTIAELEEMQDD